MRKNKKLILISSILVTTAVLIMPATSIVNGSDIVNDSDSRLDNVVQNNQQVEMNSIVSNIGAVEDNGQVKDIGDKFTVNNTTLMAAGWGKNITSGLVFTILDDSANPKTVSVEPEDKLIFAVTNFSIQSSITNASTGVTYNVTKIADGAFGGCSGLTGTLAIPTSVTSIGVDAFRYCPDLTGTLVIPESITSIGDSAFKSCSGLTSVTIPASVTSIGKSVLSNCFRFTSVHISAGVTAINQQVFEGCNGLNGDLIIPASVISIGDKAFYGVYSNNVIFLSENPPETLGNNIFGKDVKKTLWVPSLNAQNNYSPYAVANFGLVSLNTSRLRLLQ